MPFSGLECTELPPRHVETKLQFAAACSCFVSPLCNFHSPAKVPTPALAAALNTSTAHQIRLSRRFSSVRRLTPTPTRPKSRRRSSNRSQTNTRTKATYFVLGNLKPSTPHRQVKGRGSPICKQPRKQR